MSEQRDNSKQPKATAPVKKESAESEKGQGKSAAQNGQVKQSESKETGPLDFMRSFDWGQLKK